MAKYIPLQDKLDELMEQGKKLRRRQDYLKGEHDFLTDMLLTRPVKDMEAQRRLLREWEEEIDRLEESLTFLRQEYAKYKQRQNKHMCNTQKTNSKMTDLSKLSSKELEALLAQKKEEERRQALDKRAAYEGIRAELIADTERKVRAVCAEVQDLCKYCQDEVLAFRKIMLDYGQLKLGEKQMSFKIQDASFAVEIKSNKVKRFDERADVAATRLIEFLQGWIEGKEDGQDNPMYQLAMTLLERNKYGDLDYKSISKLYELEEQFGDPEYTAIMNLFKESHLVEGTATNFYFYEKTDLGVWKKLEPSFNRL